MVKKCLNVCLNICRFLYPEFSGIPVVQGDHFLELFQVELSPYPGEDLGQVFFIAGVQAPDRAEELHSLFPEFPDLHKVVILEDI